MGDLIHRFLSDINIVLTESTGELSILFVILLLFVIIVLTGFYVYNRSKNLTKLSKQIPASLVRAHLNSIIKNSKDLKDSLFLGEGENPLNESKNDILAIREELREKENIIKDLKEKTAIQESSNIAIPSSDVEKIIKERDDLLLRISDYQKVEEDFVNIKKLKQENEELRAKLGVNAKAPVKEVTIQSEEKGSADQIVETTETKTEGQVPKEDLVSQPTKEVAETEKPNKEVELPKEDLVSKPSKEVVATEELKKEEELSKEEKSAEELLKEFEKMLG